MNNESLSYRWPSDFPPDIPNKLGVIPASGKVYRLVRTIPPTAVDFKRHRDEKPKYPYTQDQIPLSYGVSFWSTLTQIQRAEQNYPHPEQYGQWCTVCGNLIPDLGVIPEELSDDGHITLWVQEGQEPHIHIKDEVKK